MNDADQALIDDYYFQCDPKQPLEADDTRYIDFDLEPGIRFDDTFSARVALERTVRRHAARPKMGASVQLFSGFPGSGKTTEIKRLIQSLEQDSNILPIYLDADDFFNTREPLRIDYVLTVIAAELDAKARASQGLPAGGEGSYLGRFWNFLCSTEVEFKSFSLKAPGVEVGALLKTNDYFGELLTKVMRRELQRFIEDARDSMSASLLALRRARSKEQVLVIFDSLEKAEPTDAQRSAAEELFVKHGEHLRLPCHAIYTYPLWLTFQVTNLPLMVDSDPQLLPMVKLWTQAGQPSLPGRTKLKEMLSARVSLQKLFGQQEDDLTTQLLEASGGYFRDVLRLVRSILNRANGLPVDARAVTRAILDLEQSYAYVFRDQDLDLLAHVAMHRTLLQSDDAAVVRIQKLIKDMQILSYRNGVPWYDIHPMLRRHPKVRARIAALQAPASVPSAENVHEKAP